MTGQFRSGISTPAGNAVPPMGKKALEAGQRIASTTHQEQAIAGLSAMKLLLIEDSCDVAPPAPGQLNPTRFDPARFDADTMEVIGDGGAVPRTQECVAVVLDPGLLNECGPEVAYHLQTGAGTIPVLTLTASAKSHDHATGSHLATGDAVEPVVIEELKPGSDVLARWSGATHDGVIKYANVRLNPKTQDILIGGKTLWLSQRETQLLELLMRRAGQTVPKSTIEERLFEEQYDFRSEATELYVRRLRKRLKQHGAQMMIFTIRGAGYSLSGPANT